MSRESEKIRIGILGVGKLGECILRGVLESPFSDQLEIFTRDKDQKKLGVFIADFGVQFCQTNRELVNAVDILILCVKPFHAEEVLREIEPGFRKDQLLISVCAGISLDQLSKWSGGRSKIVRAMPNLPAAVQEAMTAVCKGPRAEDADIQLASRIFASMGRVQILEEKFFDLVTAISGSGPGFVFEMMANLIQVAVAEGLAPAQAKEMVAQTFRGAATQVLESEKSPEELVEQVTTPGGTTEAGLQVLRNNKISETLRTCVQAATKKSEDLRSSS